MKHYFWDEPFLYKRCGDGLVRRCIPAEEVLDVSLIVILLSAEDILVQLRLQQRCSKVGYFGLLFSKMQECLCLSVIVVKE